MTYMKLHCTKTPCGTFTLARLFAGPARETSEYAGTIILPTDTFDDFLDCLLVGAVQQVTWSGERLLDVYFGPDIEDDVSIDPRTFMKFNKE